MDKRVSELNAWSAVKLGAGAVLNVPLKSLGPSDAALIVAVLAV